MGFSMPRSKMAMKAAAQLALSMTPTYASAICFKPTT
jgi:hypothetical protein